jgi:glyoxylase-like metal-dependent hydrolase (beta-lactamase superfamily II)
MEKNDLTAGYFFTDFPYYDKQNNLNSLKCLSFIIIHPVYGPMIFDTGSSYNTDQMVDNLYTFFNLHPDDFKWVFNTHIHPDHMGSNFLFKNATIVFSKKDYEMEEKISKILSTYGDIKSFFKNHCPGYENFYDDDEIVRMRKISNDCWSSERIGMKLNVKFIEDSPSIPPFIKIFRSPGHTHHHYSFKIAHNNKNIYITGDAVSNRQVIRSDINQRMEEPHMDINAYFCTLSEFMKFEGIFIPGHDRPFQFPSRKSIKDNVFEINSV